MSFTRQAQAYANSKYGRGTGSSLLDSLQCHGHEQDLSACTGARFSNYNCGQGNDAGVNCSRYPSKIKTITFIINTITVFFHPVRMFKP